MNETTFTRRYLVAAIALSGAAGGLRASRVFAQDISVPNDNARPTLSRIARQLYPHDAIDDTVYAEVIINALAQAAGDPSLLEALTAAEAALNAGQPENFVDLDFDAQTRALERIENEPYFAAIQGAVLAGVYNHPAVWELVGYGGPSWQQGGYLNRGAGEVDWLPDAGGETD